MICVHGNENCPNARCREPRKPEDRQPLTVAGQMQLVAAIHAWLKGETSAEEDEEAC